MPAGVKLHPVKWAAFGAKKDLVPQKQQPRDRLWLNDGSCIHCARRIGLIQVIEQLVHAMILHGIPQYIRSDNGPEFIAKELRSWLQGVGVKTAYIEPGSP